MIEILLKDIKPISINVAYANAKNGGRFNTRKYCEFLKLFRFKMYRYDEALKNFEKNFNDSKESIALEFTFYLPRKRYFTTQGRVNLRSGDASNFIKTTEDALFKRFNSIDDSQVKKISSEKIVSDDDFFHIGIKIYAIEF